MQFASLLFSIVIFILVLFSEKLIHQIELLSKRSLNQARGICKEPLEVWRPNDLFSIVLRHLAHFDLLNIFFGLALRAQLTFALECLLALATCG